MCLCFYTSLRSINLNLMKLNFFIYNNYYLWNIAQNIVFNTRITKIVKMTTLIAFIYHYYKVYFCLSLPSLVISVKHLWTDFFPLVTCLR